MELVWSNVCDTADHIKVRDFSFISENNKTTLTTPERVYVLKKIDKAPIYELVIEGQKLEMTNKRLSIYYTTKTALPLFKEHDCGDFDG